MIKNAFCNIPSWAFWDDVFNQEELQKLISQCSQLKLNDGTIGAGEINKDIRKSNVCFVHSTLETRWIFDKFNWVIDQINTNWYGFDLEGYDAFQYTEYEAVQAGHYDMHMDCFFGQTGLWRKLSLTVPLNDDYEGGEFQIQPGKTIETLPQKTGRVIAFPSFLLHRVMPVTKGTRKSIVIWVAGPKFR